ncbi:MAG: protein kinase [Planctomycetota bacterium]|nr:protein kinase [Planctomycetota bacterium]
MTSSPRSTFEDILTRYLSYSLDIPTPSIVKVFQQSDGIPNPTEICDLLQKADLIRPSESSQIFKLVRIEKSEFAGKIQPNERDRLLAYLGGATTLNPTSEDPESSNPVSSPQHLGRYEILKEIGRGGMGIVYRARDDQLDRHVALKVFRSGRFGDPNSLERFRREARATARLHHPHIVPIHDVGFEDGEGYLAMELIDGVPLDQYLRDHDLQLREIVQLLLPLCEALHYVHINGIVHRDLKPSNILIDREGRPHITDFGLAKDRQISENLTESGIIVGTPSYMAPEQAQGETEFIDARTDVYAAGVLFYEMLTGRPPFVGKTPMQILHKVLETDPSPPRKIGKHIPKDAQTICLKALQKDPILRYPSARSFSDDLQRMMHGNTIRARPTSFVERLTLALKNPLGISVGINIALATLLLSHGPHPSPPLSPLPSTESSTRTTRPSLPPSPEARSLISRSLLEAIRSGIPKELLVPIQQKLTAHPDHPRARLDLARMLGKRGRQEIAHPLLKAMTTKSDGPMKEEALLLNYQIATHGSFSRTLSLRQFAQKLEQETDSNDPRYRGWEKVLDAQRLAGSRRETILSEAIQLLERATLANARDLWAHDLLARAYIVQGNYPRAEIQTQNGLRVEPTDPDLSLTAMTLHALENRPEKAHKLFRRIRRSSPLDPTVLVRWGEIALRSGDLTSASHSFEEALALNPTHLDAQVGRVRAHRLKQDVTSFLGEILQKDPHHGNALALSAFYESSQKRWIRCYKRLDSLIKNRPHRLILQDQKFLLLIGPDWCPDDSGSKVPLPLPKPSAMELHIRGRWFGSRGNSSRSKKLLRQAESVDPRFQFGNPDPAKSSPGD